MSKQPEPKDTAEKPAPEEHDAPGLSPMERMTKLARRIVNVPAKELTREKRRQAKRKHG